MLVDGLTLTQGSAADNLSIASGADFPANSTKGELFFKNGVGLFYNTGADWAQISALDANGKLVVAQLPSIAINSTTVVASQAAMLALEVEVGDIAVRSDLNKTFVLAASPATTLSNWIELLAGAQVIQAYDLAVFIDGKPAAGSFAIRMPAARAFKLIAGARANSAVAATASAVFQIQKNGSSIGTITFAAAASSATITNLVDQTFAVGDVLSITCPATQDGTLSDIAVTLPAVQL